MVKVFVDTNILVYTIDKHNLDKQNKALSIFSEAAKQNSLVISTQVLQEFYNVMTGKMKMDKLKAKDVLQDMQDIETVLLNRDIIERAIDLNILEQISFWDSLIVAAAEYANCEEILSEDLQDGRSIRGIKIVNPFKRKSSNKL
ncbi:putative PIN domain protein [Candidatus Termititenax aidoneus]|uniref:PIN domain protein n=1 Tax=Termititenax aidoneus TaxID=2218524 RepID=A0A388T7N1_TERA1|nr:putative PIN domain protein [Candidatus Termititenax aidoneus]